MGEEVASALRRMRRRTEEASRLESRIALHFITLPPQDATKCFGRLKNNQSWFWLHIGEFLEIPFGTNHL